MPKIEKIPVKTEEVTFTDVSTGKVKTIKRPVRDRSSLKEDEEILSVISEIKSMSEGKITVEYSETKNLGDYNSARVTATVTLPINPSASDIKEAKESIQVAFEVVHDFVESKIAEITA